MRICRRRLRDFRGWAELDLRPRGHVLLIGVPRAGRSDIIAALTRLVEPASARPQPTLADIRQSVRPPEAPPSVVSASPENSVGDQPPTEREGTAVVDQAAGAQTATPDGDGGGASRIDYADYAEVEVTLGDLDAELEQLCNGFLEPLACS